MPKQLSKEERREYQREYRIRQKQKAALAGEIEAPAPESDVARETSPVEVQPPQLAGSLGLAPAKPPLTKAEILRRLAPAPIEDCGSCNHDRHALHPNGGACLGYNGRVKCRCRRFHEAGEPTTPCVLCGHDLDGGHAVTPCDTWGKHGPCGCPDYTEGF